jgi:Nucleotidyl transferase AbiEii toxin, Type IV TA system
VGTTVSRPAHLEALTTAQRRILRACSKPTQAWGAYLAGGAAIALSFGHRRSDDFDWFGPRAVPPAELLEDVRTLGRTVEVDQNDEGTFLGHVDGVKFSVFRYRYPLLAETIAVQGCQLASLADIAAMKLLAVAQRAVKRDYVDIHALLTIGELSLEEMVYAFHKKFPTGEPSVVLRALAHAEGADKGPMPEMLNDTTWGQVKKDLTRALERFDLSRALKGPPKGRGR